MSRTLSLVAGALALVSFAACAEVGDPADEAAAPLQPGCIMTDLGQECFMVQDGLAIAEGDIVLGDAATVQGQAQAQLAQQDQGEIALDSYWSSTSKRWPNRTVPYVIGPGFNSTGIANINAAIHQYNTYTSLRWVARTTQADYVVFTVNPSQCNSVVGMVGGAQKINAYADANCAIGHEMGHAAGMWHEQNRPDRDNYIVIHTENMNTTMASQFTKLTDTNYHRPYDTKSVMQYYSYAFSINGKPTITKKDGSLIPYNYVLDGEDLAWVSFMYPSYSPPAMPTTCGVLPSGTGLHSNSQISSCDSRFHLVLGIDGNLALIWSGHGALWQTNSSAAAGYALIMQSDGNLVLYNGRHAAIWASGTSGHTGAHLSLQTDGNLVIRAPDGTVLWNSHTGGH